MPIPSIQTLRAFDAAGRHQSYSKAGEELGLTHSAISHRIRALETLTGSRLFIRTGNAMVPTREGQRLLAQIRNALGLLEGVFGKEAASPTRITISVFPAFASRWLVPRLAAFRAAYPEIELALSLASEVVPLGDGIDAAIRYGPGSWPGTQSRLLSSEILFPVCAPTYRTAHDLREPTDLARCALLRHPWHPWSAWFEAAGIVALPADGPAYDDSSLLMEAALAGEGVALARGFAAADSLRSGQLVRLFATALPDRYGYHFVTPNGADRPAADPFAAWLGKLMRAEAKAITTLASRE